MTRIILFLITAGALIAQQSLEIIGAYYGVNDRFADVSNQVRSIAQQTGGGVSLMATVSTFTMGLDPAPGVSKVLRVYYKADGVFNHGEWRDGEVARIGAAARGGVQRGERGRGGTYGRGTTANTLVVTKALYGTGGRTIDVTQQLQSRVVNNRLEVQVTNANMGKDPAPANVKELLIAYDYQGRPYEMRVKENEWVRIPDAAATAINAAPVNQLRILGARYGQGNRVVDVTSQVTARVVDNKLSMNVDNNSMGGDPAVGADKVVYVVYEWNGQRYEAYVNEGKKLELPSANATPIAATNEVLVKAPAVASSGASSGIADGICFYSQRDYQGNPPLCVPLNQSVPRIAPESFGASFGSVRFFGRARQLDVYEGESYQGRTLRITGDQADLNALTGGSFFGTNQWVISPRSAQVR